MPRLQGDDGAAARLRRPLLAVPEVREEGAVFRRRPDGVWRLQRTIGTIGDVVNLSIGSDFPSQIGIGEKQSGASCGRNAHPGPAHPQYFGKLGAAVPHQERGCALSLTGELQVREDYGRGREKVTKVSISGKAYWIDAKLKTAAPSAISNTPPHNPARRPGSRVSAPPLPAPRPHPG